VSAPRFLTAFAAALAVASFLTGCGSEPRAVKAANPVKADKDRKPAPEFALKDADGKTVRLEEYKGKVVLLDFFATWCGPCKIEIPWFMDLERKNKDRGFSVLGVSMDDEGWEVVKPFLAELGVNYRVVIGNDATAQIYGGVDALPTTFLIDRNQRIAAIHIGLASKKVFEDGIEQLLQDPGGIIKDQADASRGMALPAFTLRADAK
jgi:cytochrome c biogenesis protein CcmG/thiol:disulfide interchange protein DsbE